MKSILLLTEDNAKHNNEIYLFFIMKMFPLMWVNLIVALLRTSFARPHVWVQLYVNVMTLTMTKKINKMQLKIN